MIAKLMICMLFAASVVRADDWDLAEEDVYGEARLLDSVFNNTSIDLNSILALILIGVLALITLGPNFLGGGSGSGYGQRNSYYNNYADYQDGYYNENQFYQRAGKVDGKFFFSATYSTMIHATFCSKFFGTFLITGKFSCEIHATFDGSFVVIFREKNFKSF